MLVQTNTTYFDEPSLELMEYVQKLQKEHERKRIKILYEIKKVKKLFKGNQNENN
jgi:hypothetical protein